MVNIDPYLTSYGRLINIENLKKELLKYVITNDSNLNYEYATEDQSKLVFITGYNSEEKELPLFEHPIIIKDIKNNNIVCIDVRKYVRQHTEQALYLKDIVKDTSSLNFLVIRAIAMSDYANGYYGVYRPVYKNYTVGYAMLISNIINAIVGLNPVEKVNVELAIGFHFNTLITDSDVSGRDGAILARLEQCKLSLPVNKKHIAITIEHLDSSDRTIDGLVSKIVSVLPEEKGTLITKGVLVNMLANIWYGAGGVESVLMSLENVPTWIALMYSATVDKTYKRSRLANILEMSSRKIVVDEIDKFISNYLKSKTL